MYAYWVHTNTPNVRFCLKRTSQKLDKQKITLFRIKDYPFVKHACHLTCQNEEKNAIIFIFCSLATFGLTDTQILQNSVDFDDIIISLGTWYILSGKSFDQNLDLFLSILIYIFPFIDLLCNALAQSFPIF